MLPQCRAVDSADVVNDMLGIAPFCRGSFQVSGYGIDDFKGLRALLDHFQQIHLDAFLHAVGRLYQLLRAAVLCFFCICASISSIGISHGQACLSIQCMNIVFIWHILYQQLDKETNYAIIINIVTLIIHRKMWIYTGGGRKNRVMHFVIHNCLLSVDKLCR